MRRRQLLGTLAAGAGAAVALPRRAHGVGAREAAALAREAAIAEMVADCSCALPQDAAPAGRVGPPGSERFLGVGSTLRITGMKVFGVTLDPKLGRADRPYVFVKIETNQGVFGWGEATLEGKASAAMACVNDLRDLVIGSDPMQVEHTYQLMYIGSFYRGGPVLGSAISGIDQALWDIRGKVMNMPVYELLGGLNRNYIECYTTTFRGGGNNLRDQAAAGAIDHGSSGAWKRISSGMIQPSSSSAQRLAALSIRRHVTPARAEGAGYGTLSAWARAS